jgi:hypothetical protein
MSEDLTPEYVATLRRMSGSQKLEAASALYWAARQLKAAALKERHPDWPDERVQQEVREIFLRAST